MVRPIQVIDLFAGPGGLSEGFSKFKVDGHQVFKIKISIEKEKFAHETLTLRSFFRQFTSMPTEYYEYLKGKKSKDQLYECYPREYKNACEETWRAELGHPDFPHSNVVKRIKGMIDLDHETIVIGGPPCQAYSLVGRSKMGKNNGFEEDPRHTLYKEYLKIIAELKPAIFVMENVKGMVSSRMNGKYIFDKILEDLRTPRLVLNPNRTRFMRNEKYTVYSLVADVPPNDLTRRDFTIKSEEYGVPQARHRVILVAVRNDINARPSTLTKVPEKVTVAQVIGDLPRLRSGLSKQVDNNGNWMRAISQMFPKALVYKNLSRGDPYTKCKATPTAYPEWYVDKQLGGITNHETRAHIAADLCRYYFISSFGERNKYSPKLEDLPVAILPNHKNVKRAIKGKSLFNDRFRVQIKDKPATTITSHISKDGHYFIHYDSRQCRSLTVREAARIQTFPDNYKFEGPRTAQYQQVGNAVPPLLAYKISALIYKVLRDAR